MDLDEVRATYERERPVFEQLAVAAADTLRRSAATARLGVRVEYRAKEMASLLKKVMFGNVEYRKLIDRAGVRVVLECPADANAIDRVVRSEFTVHKKLDVSERLGADRFGYGGIHYYLEYITPPAPPLAALRFECQVHTHAQALWASLSHRVAYKERSSDGPHVRSLHRLAALLELVDLEVARIRDDADGAPGRVVGRVAELLESHYVVLGRTAHSREITALLLPRLLPLMGRDDFGAWCDDFEAFVRDHGDQLRSIYDRYRGDTRHLLMSQPESLLVLYARARDPFSFDERWPGELGDGLRESFVGIWPNP